MLFIEQALNIVLFRHTGSVEYNSVHKYHMTGEAQRNGTLILPTQLLLMEFNATLLQTKVATILFQWISNVF